MSSLTSWVFGCLVVVATPWLYESKLPTIVGWIILVFFGYKLTKLIIHLVRPPKDLSQYGSWSVVTGATSGIGKAMAFELARKGQNILIVGRTHVKLTRILNELRTKYPNILVDLCEIDFTKFDNDAIQRYRNSIKNKDIGILINNAGLFYKRGEGVFLHQLTTERMVNIIKVNDIATSIITRETILRLLKKKRKYNKGTICNISSGTSLIPSKYVTIYGASKKFMNKMTLDLDLEYNKYGITFQVQICGQVLTKMLPSLTKPSFMVTTTDIYAKYAVKHIGYGGMCSPYPRHAILFWLLQLFPDVILYNFLGVFWTIYFKLLQ